MSLESLSKLDGIVFFNEKWHDGTTPIMSALSQSFMHGTTVFDGARFYNGCAPDLENHFSRLLASVDAMGLKIEVNINTMIDSSSSTTVASKIRPRSSSDGYVSMLS